MPESEEPAGKKSKDKKHKKDKKEKRDRTIKEKKRHNADAHDDQEEEKYTSSEGRPATRASFVEVKPNWVKQYELQTVGRSARRYFSACDKSRKK